MYLSQHNLCIRKMELALEVKFDLDFHWVTHPWQRTLTNGSDVKSVFPRCLFNHTQRARGLRNELLFKLPSGDQWTTLRRQFKEVCCQRMMRKYMTFLALATTMLCDTWLHNDTFFRTRKKPLVVSGNGILGKRAKNFGCKNAKCVGRLVWYLAGAVPVQPQSELGTYVSLVQT